jgi:ATP-dependent helicase YprA (DUF1998 family)
MIYACARKCRDYDGCLYELTMRCIVLQDLGASAPHLCSSVSSYRGGYTKSDRRKIESNLFNMKLTGVTATCALEVGVDVGHCDVTLHMGYPGSIASFWQQAGRAGRGGRDSLSVCVLFSSPTDQWVCRNAAKIMRRPPETCACAWSNDSVIRVQLLCASKEISLNTVFRVYPPGQASQHHQAYAFNDTDLWGGKGTYSCQHHDPLISNLIQNASKRTRTLLGSLQRTVRSKQLP